MINIFVHTHDPGRSRYKNQGQLFTQVPRVGEYLAQAPNDPDWYRVEVVVHCAVDATYQAEVYVARVNRAAVLKQEVDAGSDPALGIVALSRRHPLGEE